MNLKGLSFCFLALLAFSCRGPMYIKGKQVLTGEDIEVLTAEISSAQFSDLPVPASFTLQTRNLASYGTQVGSFRMGRLLYLGNLSLDEIEGYLEPRLSEHGWKLAQRNVSADGALTISYTKKDSTATYRITRISGQEGATISHRHGSETTEITKLLIDLTTGRSG